MEYRILPSEEWHKLTPLFEERGARLPNPQFADIVVAEDDGVIVGYAVKQVVVHCEPVWFAERYRGGMFWHWKKMMKVLGSAGCYIFGTSVGRERLLKRAGFKQLPYTVFCNVEQQ